MSIEEDEDFDFDDVTSDISSSGTSIRGIRLWSQSRGARSSRGALTKSRLESITSVRSGILYSRSFQVL